MAVQKSDRDSFMNDAERIMREAAASNPAIVVWRGQYRRTVGKNTSEHETVIAGLADDKSSSGPPATPILKAWVEPQRVVYLDYSTGSDQDTSIMTYLGKEHDAIGELRELAQRLASL